MEEQGQTEILKEVEMVEELKVEEKAEVTPEEETAPEAEQTPEPTTETPVGEVSSEAEAEDEATVKEKLAEEVRQRLLSCAEDAKCLDTISARFEEMSKRLHVPFDALLEEVFGLIKGK